MKPKTVLLVIALFGFCFAYGQEDVEDAKPAWKAGIRHNGSRLFYEHPKIGVPGGPLVPPTSRWYKGTKYQHYYDEGIGITLEDKLFYYRMRIDYYSYQDDGPGSVEFEGVRTSPAIGKEWKWKFMGFNAGMEMPIEWKWVRDYKWESNTGGGQREVGTRTGINGLKAIGISSFLGIDFYIQKRFSAGFELRNGVWFNRTWVLETTKQYYNSQNELYATEVFKSEAPGWQSPQWAYLIPSVSLKYSFD